VAYLINGIDLTTFATRISTAEGLQDAPDPEQGLVDLYGIDGSYDPYMANGLRPADGPGSITFDMWLLGVDRLTGVVDVTTTTDDLYYRQWDTLVRLFHRRRLIIDYVGPTGTRRALGRLASGMSPSRQPSNPWFGRFKATVVIPAAGWTDTTMTTSGTFALATGNAISLSAFSGATAPITDVKVRFGPGSNPRLTSPTGAYVQWNGVIPPGQMVEFDSATGLIGPGTGTNWYPTYAAGTYAYSPGPRFYEIDPAEGLTATITHTGGGSLNVEVLGTRRYRTSGGGAGSGPPVTTGYGTQGWGTGGWGL
jgi:hypothetical protein